MSTTRQKPLKLSPNQISTTDPVAVSFKDLVYNYYQFYCPKQRPSWPDHTGRQTLTTQLEVALYHLRTHRFKGYGVASFTLDLSDLAARTLFTSYFVRAALEDFASLDQATVRTKEQLWVTFPPTYYVLEYQKQYFVKEITLAGRGLYMLMLQPIQVSDPFNRPLPYLAYSKETFLEGFEIVSQ